MTVRTAVLMIDMQNMYLDQDKRDRFGWPPIDRLDDVVAECAALLETARAAGMPVIYTRHMSRPDGADTMPSLRNLIARMPQEESPIAGEDDWATQILEPVAPKPGDIVIEKLRWDAFYGTELDSILRNLDARRLVVAGLQTNVCIDMTARTAMMKNFEVAVPEDAVSTDGESLQVHGLDALRVLYVEVAPWRELLAPDAAWDRALTTPNYGRPSA